MLPMKWKVERRRKYAGMLSFCVLALAGQICAGMDFEVKKGISYYSPEACTNAYMETLCKLDLRYPKGVTNFATVVWFHGGGLVRGQRGYLYETPEDDVACVSVGYRLLVDGKATPTDCVSDAGAAVAWTLKHIAAYGGDPKKVFVSGASGGGYLTLMVGMDPKWLKPWGYKPTDLAGLFPRTGQASTHFTIRAVNGDSSSTYITKVDEWAPLAYAARDLPPMLIQTGEPGRDIPCRAEENHLLYASLLALGHADVQYLGHPGRRHSTMSRDVTYYEDDFIHRRVREIDDAAYSGGPNAVRACLERAFAAGLRERFVSILSSPEYALHETCAMSGHRIDCMGDGEWVAPLLEKVTCLCLAQRGEGDLPAPGTPLKELGKRIPCVDEYERAIFSNVTDELGMGYTRRREREKGVRVWETNAADLIRLAQLIAHRGEWHGRRLIDAATCEKAFPLPYAFGKRLFASADGSARVLFTCKDVSGDPRFAALVKEWLAIESTGICSRRGVDRKNAYNMHNSQRKE